MAANNNSRGLSELAIPLVCQVWLLGAHACSHLCSPSRLQASGEGMGRVLDAVATASIIVGLLQQHHMKVIQPRVETSPAEAGACSAALSACMKSVEERVLAALQAALNAFFAQVPHCWAPPCPCCGRPCMLHLRGASVTTGQPQAWSGM